MRRSAKKDANHNAITRTLRKLGIRYKETHQLPNFLDLLVLFRGELHAIEIKNPDYLPQHGDRTVMLTDGERECMNLFAAASVPYHICIDVDEVLRAIGATE